MGIWLWIGLGAGVAAIVVWYIALFNRLVRAKAMAQEAWSGIDVQLKRRHDLIPNLVEAVKGYSRHEQKVFTDITNLRVRSQQADGVKERAEAESALSGGLRGLLAVAEAYPDLKASQNFLNLHNSLNEIEDQIQMARRYYNGTVRDYNIAVQTFPSLIVARQYGYKPMEYFEIELATQRETPEVRF